MASSKKDFCIVSKIVLDLINGLTEEQFNSLLNGTADVRYVEKGLDSETKEKYNEILYRLSVENDDYTINGDRLSIYEYDESAKSTLEGDLKSITDNGMMINGNKTSWTKAAHIYKKGRLVVIYDGNNESILTTLKEVLGEPLL